MSRRREKRNIARQSRPDWAIAHGIPADRTRQAPNNSHFPPEFYVDVTFTCRDCGAKEVWSAAEQKWYYEVVKGSIYAQAVRCQACRRRRSELRRRGGDPSPIKHSGALLKRVQQQLEPALVESGFQFEGRTGSRYSRLASLTYAHRDAILTCEFDTDARLLTATIVNATLDDIVIARPDLGSLQLGDVWPELIAERFSSVVREFIQNHPTHADPI